MVDEFSFVFDGRTFSCTNESVNVSAIDPARASNARWTVEVDGVVSQAFESTPEDTKDSVRQQVIEWYRRNRSR